MKLIVLGAVTSIVLIVMALVGIAVVNTVFSGRVPAKDLLFVDMLILFVYIMLIVVVAIVIYFEYGARAAL